MTDDIIRLTHCYEVADKRMYWSQWYLEQGDIPLEAPLNRLVEQWETIILPLIAEAWGQTCRALYTTAYCVQPDTRVPGYRNSTVIGLREFPCLPPTSGGIIAFYTTIQGVIHRASLRLGGISESLGDDGILVSGGIAFLQTLAARMLEHIPYTGSDGFGWYPGIFSPGRGWGDMLHFEVRRELGTQRTRKIRRGGRP